MVSIYYFGISTARLIRIKQNLKHIFHSRAEINFEYSFMNDEDAIYQKMEIDLPVQKKILIE